MNKVEQFLNTASRAYYAGSPIISDEQFDALADIANYQTVGAGVSGPKGMHYKPMYSLQKFYEDEGMKRPLANVKDVSPSIKLDGAAISLLYIDGTLVQALTRGDGVEGQDITDKILSSNSLVVKSVPVEGILQVTGEVVAPKHIENARNYAAGALNLKNDDEFNTRALSFFAYGCYPYLTATYDGDMRALARLGFATIKELDLEKVYPSDGMVYRVNDNELFEEMGYTSKHPQGAYALKVRGAHVETTLLDVEWQVSKSGRVTPVAILEPVVIEDAVVTRATLNNPAFIEALGLAIGNRVAVIRAGSIIPCILHKVE